MNAEKLKEIVNLLAQVRSLLDGGWHYSSPLIRDEPNLQGLLERADALGMVVEIGTDLGMLAAALGASSEKAKELDVDTRQLCGADLALLSKTYGELSAAVSTAATAALEVLTSPDQPERKTRKRKSAAQTEQTTVDMFASQPTNTIVESEPSFVG